MEKRQRIDTCGHVQFISHYTEQYGYLDAIRMALEGGCRWIQLRMKGITDEEVRPVALQAQALCRQHQAVFLIDDRAELVKELEADGVHLGRHDMPIEEARRLLGETAIIGGTANTFDDIRRLADQGADYIGCGPFRFTTTKEKLSPLLGLEGYRCLLQQMKEANIRIPLVAIGGITPADIPALRQVGVQGIALSGSVLRAANPVEAMHRVMACVVGPEEGDCHEIN